MFLHPFSLGAQNRREIGHFGIPAEYRLRFLRVRDKCCGIAYPPRRNTDRNRSSGDVSCGFDYLKNGMTGSASEIEELTGTSQPQIVECKKVCFGKITHVNVVADGRSIRRRVIISENGNLGLRDQSC